VNVIDLFAGAGGFSEGFQKAGYKIIAANEINDQIAKTYKLNHPNTKMFIKDIKLLEKDLSNLKTQIGNKKIDVIIGGPPCQGFSMAGARIRGNSFIEDPRNYLFKHYYNIIMKFLPDYFVMENVPGLLSSKNGKIIKEIEKIFAENTPYKLDKAVLNAKNFGVPQSRQRLIIIGAKKKKLDLNREIKKYYKKPQTVKNAISDLNYLSSGEGSHKSNYKHDPLTNYQKERRMNSAYLYNHIATNHSSKTLERIRKVAPGENRESLNEKINSVHSGSYGRLEWDEIAKTITTRFDTPSGGRFIHPELNRTITLREAARIQSFDDNYEFVGNKSSIKIQIGNAVPPILAKQIANLIKDYSNKNNK
jgi:DNA (cytosine-5)-methyltransferase 1